MITVICPVFNEANYISNVIDFFISALPKDKELIIVDGGSTDNTNEIIESYIKANSNIKLIENPDKYVPFALNRAIAASNGDPIIRLDAHTQYSPDYFIKILDTFNSTGADIVGGPMRAKGSVSFQRAVAIATATSFGIGDSAFHDDRFEGWVDSVYLGAWKREIFNTVGYFDTDMIRNQDDEFHYRAKSKGKKIYLNPVIKSWYSPRSTVRSLFKQYYQYGLFKPLVLKKVKSGLKLRHLIPAGFVLYLALLFVFNQFLLAYIPLVAYLLLALYFAITKTSDIKIGLSTFIVYPILHISYGLGFIKGTVTLWLGQNPKI